MHVLSDAAIPLLGIYPRYIIVHMQYDMFLRSHNIVCNNKKLESLPTCIIMAKPFKRIPQFFPHSSVGKESTCNAGDPGLIPGSGRSTGEGIGYPLQYSWASLVAELVMNPPAKQEIWVLSLGWEDPLEKGKVTHSSILAWRIP